MIHVVRVIFGVFIILICYVAGLFMDSLMGTWLDPAKHADLMVIGGFFVLATLYGIGWCATEVLRLRDG